jgi:hypothetical protein
MQRFWTWLQSKVNPRVWQVSEDAFFRMRGEWFYFRYRWWPIRWRRIKQSATVARVVRWVKWQWLSYRSPEQATAVRRFKKVLRGERME